MDLTEGDVAKLLHISSDAVEQLANNGKIPFYKLADKYRFSRLEIEEWMIAGNSPIKGEDLHQIYPMDSDKDLKMGSQQYSLFRAIHKGDVLTDIVAETKEQIIKETLHKVSVSYGFDADMVTDLFLDRERLMPTALGSGIAVPHSRDFVLNHAGSDAVVVVCLKNPVDYGALDQVFVHTLFFLFSSSDKKHLQLLAKIAHLSSSAKALDLFKAQPSKNQLLDFVKAWESTLR